MKKIIFTLIIIILIAGCVQENSNMESNIESNIDREKMQFTENDFTITNASFITEILCQQCEKYGKYCKQGLRIDGLVNIEKENLTLDYKLYCKVYVDETEIDTQIPSIWKDRDFLIYFSESEFNTTIREPHQIELCCSLYKKRIDPEIMKAIKWPESHIVSNEVCKIFQKDAVC